MKHMRRLVRLEHQVQEHQQEEWTIQAFLTEAEYEAALAAGYISPKTQVLIGVDVDAVVGRKLFAIDAG